MQHGVKTPVQFLQESLGVRVEIQQAHYLYNTLNKTSCPRTLIFRTTLKQAQRENSHSPVSSETPHIQ